MEQNGQAMRFIRSLQSCCDTPSPAAEGERALKADLEGYLPQSDQLVEQPIAEHKWKCNQSVLSLATHKNLVYAGTEKGEIYTYDLTTWQQLKNVSAHQGGVTCLTIAVSGQEEYLISGGSDSLIKVWDLRSTDKLLKELYTIYTLYDIGDIFSLAWSSRTQTLYFGCQNASINWIDLQEARAASSPHSLPSVRSHKFFDSRGPGGKVAPQQTRRHLIAEREGELLEVPPANCARFAHNGYVYAMLTCTLRDGSEVLVSGAGDGSVKVWDQLRSGLGIGTSSLKLRTMFETENLSPVMCLSHAATYLFCGLAKGSVALFDLETCQNRRMFQCGDHEIFTLCNTGPVLFKGTKKKVQIWDPLSYASCEWQAHEDLTLASAFSEYDGKRRLLTAGNDGAVAVWRMDELNHHETGQIPKALDNDQMIKTLGSLVSYKTVSSHDGNNWFDSRRCAAYLQSLFLHFGAEAKLLAVEPSRNPIVYAKFTSNSREENTEDKAHIVFYGHYDVITASSKENWDTDPYQLTSMDGYVYGRGVSDNKGPVLSAMFAAADLMQSKSLKNDVTFIIEGEEECGSVGFTDTISTHRELFGDVDWILLSNSYWIDDTTPCLNYGLRGVVNLTVKIYSGLRDLHSGVHGGVHREPMSDMIALLSKLSNPETGSIVVPHFYDNIRPVTEAEERLYDDIVSTGLEVTKDNLMKKWRYPSLTIHGIDASGPRNATVIPASVSARISLRIVPDQSLEEIKMVIEKFLNDSFASLDSPNNLEIAFAISADPWLGDPTNHAFQVLRKAISDEWGTDPIFIREGGSIPVVRRLERMLKAPAAQLPCGQASDGAHLNNERLRISNFFKTRQIIKRAFAELRPRSV